MKLFFIMEVSLFWRAEKVVIAAVFSIRHRFNPGHSNLTIIAEVIAEKIETHVSSKPFVPT
jgi:hypothetical protein